MDWTLAEIKAKVRSLTGRPDTGQLSDADLLKFINNFYQLTLPILLKPDELQDWFTQAITQGAGDTYSVGQTYLVLDAPYTLDGKTVKLYRNPLNFYEKWPETQTYSDAEPFEVLYYNRKLIFRPPPDGNYTFKASTFKRPTALSDAQNPLNNIWGPLITYGSSIDIHIDAGEVAEAKALDGGFSMAISIATGEALIHGGSVRCKPRF